MAKNTYSATEKAHTFSDSLAIGAYPATLLLWVISPSIGSHIVALLVVAFVSCYLAYRSHFTRKFTVWLKHGIAILIILAIAVAGYMQWRGRATSRSTSNSQVSVPAATSVDVVKQSDSLPQPRAALSSVRQQKVRPVGPITQTANDSTCSNVVAGGDVKIDCSLGKKER